MFMFFYAFVATMKLRFSCVSISGWIRQLLSALGAGPSASASDLLRVSVLVLVVVVAVSSVLSWLRTYLYGMAGERLVLRLRRQLFERIMAMEVWGRSGWGSLAMVGLVSVVEFFFLY